MLLLHDQLAPFVTAPMRGHHHALGNDFDPMDIRLDRDLLKSPAPGHRIAVGVVANRLILIDAGLGGDTGIESPLRQAQGRRLLAGETLPHGLRLPRLDLIELTETALTQISIQFVQVPYPRHRRGPVALQIIDAVFHVWFFLAAGRQTKQRIKPVMTGQGRIPRLDLTLTTLEKGLGDGPGIVPPYLPGHTPEKIEGLHHPRQNGFDPLRRQGLGIATSRIAPGGHQHRYLSSAVRKIHVDMPKVGFQTSTGRMIQWDERLPGLPAVLPDVAAHLIVTALITLFIS
jgi:hypothetical protein